MLQRTARRRVCATVRNRTAPPPASARVGAAAAAGRPLTGMTSGSCQETIVARHRPVSSCECCAVRCCTLPLARARAPAQWLATLALGRDEQWRVWDAPPVGPVRQAPRGGLAKRPRTHDDVPHRSRPASRLSAYTTSLNRFERGHAHEGGDAGVDRLALARPPPVGGARAASGTPASVAMGNCCSSDVETKYAVGGERVGKPGVLSASSSMAREAVQAAALVTGSNMYSSWVEIQVACSGLKTADTFS
eukprot:364197-Chlamydomonas_euryale.AAC.38